VKTKAVRPEPVEGSPRSSWVLTDETKSTSPGVARQLVTFFCFAKKKVTQEKATPIRHLFEVPCVARLVRRLRNSHDPLRVHVLKHTRRTTPDPPALLGGVQGNENQKIGGLQVAHRLLKVCVSAAR
jgi:hypothetical protein